MTSHPVIEWELSATEHEFVAWVEAQTRSQHNEGLTGFSVASWDTDDLVLIERRRIEFGAEHIAHTMKRIEYRHGMCRLIESQFELTGPEIPDGNAHHTDVEAAVKVRVDQMKAERPGSA